MNHAIRQQVLSKISNFYHNVAKKYKHTYSEELMHKNIDDAYNSIYLIENGLMRREPTISRWKKKGLFMATYFVKNRSRWNFAYRIDGDTIYVEDACHAQNMHEAIERLRSLISEEVRRCLQRI